MKKIFVVAVMLFSAFSLFAIPAGKIIQETLEAAAKISGKKLSASGLRAMEKELAKELAKRGDDVLRITRKGGLEVLEQGAKYGDDFWAVARHADPAAVRSLALHTRELLPHAKRIGPAFLELEGKVPGLAVKAVSLFGDDTVKALAKAPAEDISRLIGLAGTTNSKSTRNFLLKGYFSSSNREKFLSAFDWKKITATGLSSAAIIAAYKTSDGIGEGLKTLAESEPGVFVDLLSNVFTPVKWLLFILLLPLLLLTLKFTVWFCRKIRIFSKKSGGEKETSSPEPQNVTDTGSQKEPEQNSGQDTDTKS